MSRNRRVPPPCCPQTREEPRTMRAESFENWLDTMGGIDDVSRVEQESRIPVLSSRWAYENWTQRGQDPQLGRRVPPVQWQRGSRIPVPYASMEREGQCTCVQMAQSRPSRLPVPIPRGHHRRAGRQDSSSSSCSSSDDECRNRNYPPTRIPGPTYTRTTRHASKDEIW
jgi:hypothetical protein